MIKGLVIAAAVAATLPDPKLTPGRTDPRVTQANIATTICVPGYTKKVRPPVSVTNKIKKRVMLDYHAPGPAANYELDHLIPLSEGGAPADPENLWPQPYCKIGNDPRKSGCYGAREKDKVEDAFRHQICAGKLSLADAQRRIVADWIAEYNSIMGIRMEDARANSTAARLGWRVIRVWQHELTRGDFSKLACIVAESHKAAS